MATHTLSYHIPFDKYGYNYSSFSHNESKSQNKPNLSESQSNSIIVAQNNQMRFSSIFFSNYSVFCFISPHPDHISSSTSQILPPSSQNASNTLFQQIYLKKSTLSDLGWLLQNFHQEFTHILGHYYYQTKTVSDSDLYSFSMPKENYKIYENEFDDHRSSLNMSLYKSSIIYRSRINEFIQLSSSNQFISYENKSHFQDSFSSTIQEIDIIHLFWHITEVLFIFPYDNIVYQLVEWYKDSYFPLFYQNDHIALSTSSSFDLSLFLRSVSVGNIKSSRTYLSRHYLDIGLSFNIYSAIDEILSTIPSLCHQGYQPEQFNKILENWRNYIKSLQNVDNINHLPVLKSLCSLLLGNLDVSLIASLSLDVNDKDSSSLCYFQNWVELLLYLLIYVDPLMTRSQLRPLVDSCFTTFNPKLSSLSNLSYFHQTIYHLFHFNIHEAICLWDIFLDSSWFMAHLVDLLSRLHLVSLSPLYSDSLNIHHHFLYQYAIDLFSDNTSFHSLSFAYFIECGDIGYHSLYTLLDTIPIRSFQQSLKIISNVEKYRLDDIAIHLGKKFAKYFFLRHQYGISLYWYNYIHQEAMIATIFQKCLIDIHLSSPSLSIKQLLEYIPDHSTHSSTNLYYGKLYLESYDKFKTDSQNILSTYSPSSPPPLPSLLSLFSLYQQMCTLYLSLPFPHSPLIISSILSHLPPLLSLLISPLPLPLLNSLFSLLEDYSLLSSTSPPSSK